MSSVAPLRPAGFRGIDPPGLEALARWCHSRGRDLAAAGRETRAVAAYVGDDGLIATGRLLEAVTQRMVEWAAELAEHVAAMEAAQRACGLMHGLLVDVTDALRRGIVDVALFAAVAEWRDDPVGAAFRLGRSEAAARSSAVAALGLGEVFTWVDHLIGAEPGHDGSGAGDPAGAIEHLVRSLGAEDVLRLVRMLVAAGHDDRVVGSVVDGVADAGKDRIADVAASAVAMHRDGQRAGTIVMGRLLLVGDATTIDVVARHGIGSPGALAPAMRRAVATAASSDRAAALASMTAALATIQDLELRAGVALELMAASVERTSGPWRQQLDGIITEILLVDARRTIARIAEDLDPTATRVVPWVRRLFPADDGAERLRRLLDAFERQASTAGERAMADGYLSGVLAAATTMEAAEGRNAVGDLGVVAGRVEMFLSSLWALPAAASIVAPGSLDIGVVGVTSRADGRIDRAMWRLLGLIEERFAPTEQVYGPDLGAALETYRAVRDHVVGHWRS